MSMNEEIKRVADCMEDDILYYERLLHNKMGDKNTQWQFDETSALLAEIDADTLTDYDQLLIRYDAVIRINELDKLLNEIDEFRSIISFLPDNDQLKIKILDDELSTYRMSIDDAWRKFHSIKNDILKNAIDVYKQRYVNLFKKVLVLGEADIISVAHDMDEEIKGRGYGAGYYLMAAYALLEQKIDAMILIDANTAPVSNDEFKRNILELNKGRDHNNRILELDEIEHLLNQVIMTRTQQYGADILKKRMDDEWVRLLAKKPPLVAHDEFMEDKQNIFNKIVGLIGDVSYQDTFNLDSSKKDTLLQDDFGDALNHYAKIQGLLNDELTKFSKGKRWKSAAHRTNFKNLYKNLQDQHEKIRETWPGYFELLSTNVEKIAAAEKYKLVNKNAEHVLRIAKSLSGETIQEKYEKVKDETTYLVDKYLTLYSKKNKLPKNYDELIDIYIAINKNIEFNKNTYTILKNKNNSIFKRAENIFKNNPAMKFLKGEKNYIHSLGAIKKDIQSKHVEMKRTRTLLKTVNEMSRLQSKLSKFDQAPAEEGKIAIFKSHLDRSKAVITKAGKIDDKTEYEFEKIKKGIHKLSAEIRNDNKQYVSELNAKLHTIKNKLRIEDDMLATQLEVVEQDAQKVKNGMMNINLNNHHKELVESYLQYIDQLNADVNACDGFRKIYEEDQLNYNELQTYRQNIENLEFNVDTAQKNMDKLLKIFPLFTDLIFNELPGLPKKYMEFVALYEMIRKNGNDYFAREDCVHQLIRVVGPAIDALLTHFYSRNDKDDLVTYLTPLYDFNQNKLSQKYSDLLNINSPEYVHINRFLNRYSTDILKKRNEYEKKNDLANKDKAEAIKQINSFSRKLRKDMELFQSKPLQSKSFVKLMSSYSDITTRLDADLAHFSNVNMVYECNKNNYNELDKYYDDLAYVKYFIEIAVDNFEAIRDLEPLITQFIKQVSFNHSPKVTRLEHLLESVIMNKEHCLLDESTVSKLREEFMLAVLDHLSTTDSEDLRNIPLMLSVLDQRNNSAQYDYSNLFKEYGPHLLPYFTQLLAMHKINPYFELKNQRESFRRTVTNAIMRIEVGVIKASSQETRSTVDTMAAADQFNRIKEKHEDYADIYEEFISEIKTEYKSLLLEYDNLENEINDLQNIQASTSLMTTKIESLKAKSEIFNQNILGHAKKKEEHIEYVKSLHDRMSCAKGNFDNQVMRSDKMSELFTLKHDMDQSNAQLNMYQSDKKNYLKKLEKLNMIGPIIMHDYESLCEIKTNNEWNQTKDFFVGKLYLGENDKLCNKISSDLQVVEFFADLKNNIDRLINHDKPTCLFVDEYKVHSDYKELFSLLSHLSSATYTLITEYTKDFDHYIAKLLSELNKNIEAYKVDLTERVIAIDKVTHGVSHYLISLQAKWCSEDKALWSQCQDLSNRFSSSQEYLDTIYERANYFYSPQVVAVFNHHRSPELTPESLQNLFVEANQVAKQLTPKSDHSVSKVNAIIHKLYEEVKPKTVHSEEKQIGKIAIPPNIKLLLDQTHAFFRSKSNKISQINKKARRLDDKNVKDNQDRISSRKIK